MSLTLTTLDPADFDAFSAAHPQGNFQQTSRMGERRARAGVGVEYVGVERDGALAAAAQLEVHHGRLSTFAEVHDGPLCDLRDRELTAALVGGLRERARAAGAVELVITPEAPYRVRDSLGNPLVAGEPLPAGVPAGSPAEADDESVRTLLELGFEHDGFTVGYTDVPRWRYVKDLTGIDDEAALLASYTKNTRRDVRIAHESCVRVERLGRDELPLFHHVCEISCEKQGFENHSLDYFESLYDALGDRIEFNAAVIDMGEYLRIWEAKRDQLAADMARLEQAIEQGRAVAKSQRRLADAREKHAAAVDRVNLARDHVTQGEERVTAAVGAFVWHPRECVYLFSGSDAAFTKFCAPLALQHHMMLACLGRGVRRYNLYGINGVFGDRSDPGYGLLEFKQGFGGYVEELMGTFTLPVRPLARGVGKMVHRMLGR
ncbi:peptidoglycan bridge formation glycyltransferase FemA/FemB family protein [Thermophilibacter sp.]